MGWAADRRVASYARPHRRGRLCPREPVTLAYAHVIVPGHYAAKRPRRRKRGSSSSNSVSKSVKPLMAAIAKPWLRKKMAGHSPLNPSKLGREATTPENPASILP